MINDEFVNEKSPIANQSLLVYQNQLFKYPKRNVTLLLRSVFAFYRRLNEPLG